MLYIENLKVPCKPKFFNNHLQEDKAYSNIQLFIKHAA